MCVFVIPVFEKAAGKSQWMVDRREGQDFVWTTFGQFLVKVLDISLDNLDDW